MTRLAERKTKLVLTTEATARYRGRERNIVIEMQPHTAILRLLGTRTRYEISWRGVFDRAAAIAAERIRAERLSRRRKS